MNKGNSSINFKIKQEVFAIFVTLLTPLKRAFLVELTKDFFF